MCTLCQGHITIEGYLLGLVREGNFFRPLELGMFQATRKDISCIHTASSASDSAVIRCLNGDIAKERLPVVDKCLQRGVSEIFVLPVEDRVYYH